jgi:hypothetical protein
MRLIPILFMLALAFAPEAAAQDVGAEPTYGDVRLSAGFLPDPHVVELTAGGSIEVNKEDCAYGFVANAPDTDFYYEGNNVATLYIYAESDSDTMILINTPDGSWRCDDDSHGELNPLLTLTNAPSGLYNIWVGTYGNAMVSATLNISEIDPE